MSIKEKIVQLIQEQGYDVLSACEIAEDTIKDARESLEKSNVYRFTINGKVYEIRNNQ